VGGTPTVRAAAELQQERDYWLAERRKPVARLPVDYSGERTRWLRRTPVSLNQKETQALLQQVPKAYNTQINDVLLTALVQALQSGQESERCWWNKKDTDGRTFSM